MEVAMKTKLNGMLKELENNKAREEELKSKIRQNCDQTEQEERTVMELHSKLQVLEETLREKENDNVRLRLQLRDCKVEAECVDEFKERNEVEEIHETFKGKQLRDEYGDLLIVNNTVKSKAKELTDEIRYTERQLRNEEDLCAREEERNNVLERQHDGVIEKLREMLQTQDEIRERESVQREKIRALRQKHMETEERAQKLEQEVCHMEKKIDNMTERLIQMKDEQENLVKALKQQQRYADVSIESLGKHNQEVNKAQRVIDGTKK